MLATPGNVRGLFVGADDDVARNRPFHTPLYFRHARTPGGISDTNDVCNVL